MELTTIVTPDTFLRWHRTLVGQQWDHTDGQSRNPGRPRIRQVVVTIIEPSEEIGQDEGDIQCQERLGGILRYYHRAAA